MKHRVIAVTIFAVLMLGVFSPSAYAFTYNDVASEFMCQCGCNLVLKDCETMVCGIKDKLKVSINGMIDSGKTKAEIIKVMRVNYKDQILSAPPKEGFNWTAYITPFALVIMGGAGITYILNMWVKRRDELLVPVAGDNGDKKRSKKSAPIDKKYSDQLNKELDDLRWY